MIFLENFTSPLVSIVILNYNGDICLNNCLRSVFETQYPSFEVVLVDNASRDKSLKKALEAFGAEPRLKIVQNPTNMGFSGGNNVGYAESKGEFIVFLNNDTVVEPNWLRILVDAMEKDPSIGLAQSMILTIDGKKIQTAGWLFSNYLIQKYALFAGHPSQQECQPIFEVSFACGAAMIIRREIAETMGLFDSKAPFFYDDTLLSVKSWLAKKRVVTVSASKVRHLGGATNVWNTRFTTYNLLKSNACLLFDAYPGITELAKALLIYLAHTSSDSLFCLRNKRVDVFIENIRGMKWLLLNFKYLWKNKLRHWAKSIVSSEELKEKFLRVNLPVPLFLLPTRLGIDYFESEIRLYEKKLTKKKEKYFGKKPKMF